jgi:hypothetical protein
MRLLALVLVIAINAPTTSARRSKSRKEEPVRVVSNAFYAILRYTSPYNVCCLIHACSRCSMVFLVRNPSWSDTWSLRMYGMPYSTSTHLSDREA